MRSNAVVLQCGGPTAVINASLCGVMSACHNDPRIERLWGARHGVRGLVSGDWIDLTQFQTSVNDKLSRLEAQPGAALESGRDRLADDLVGRALDHLQRQRIGVLFIIGGNGSMVAAQKLGEAAKVAGYSVDQRPLRVIAIPKTIDNDITGTDACPGYGSAARFVAQTARDVSLDLYAMRDFDDVAVIEVMGRHAGWLGGGGAGGGGGGGAPPHLILLPEVTFDEERFLAAVERRHKTERMCVVVAAEGIRDSEGVFLAEQNRDAERDSTGQKLFGLAGGPSPHLAAMVKERLGLRCRQMRPDLIQRSSSATASHVDRALARRAAEAAVEMAGAGLSGVMVGLERGAGDWSFAPVGLEQVTGRERTLPPEFIDATGLDVTAEFIKYARPLIGEDLPEAVRLWN